MHATRVEVDVSAGPDDLAYIRSAAGLTDVVVASRGDAVAHLFAAGRLIEQLTDIDAVNSVRLRSLMFNYSPERFTRAVIDRLGRLNCLEIAKPLRLEIETQFLHADEIRPEHQTLARALLNHGVTVYSNTPLLAGINDSPAEINRIAYRLREIGVEFHHLYVAGLPLQKLWNTDHPVDVADVIDIGTRVRRDGSGREIPRYIIRTRLGEADFGLTSRLVNAEGALRVELTPYDLAYFQQMDPDFGWPAGVTTTTDGHPVVAVSGLRDTGGFMVS
jgi:L-lysine 2,3-aminomutase